MIEIWLDVREFSGLYKVSNRGRCFSFRKQSLIYGYYDKDGYLITTLRDKNNKKFMRKIHRLVALAFIPNPYGKPHVCHNDTNKLNNHVSNLEWGTEKENCNNVITISKKEIPVAQYDLNDNLIQIWKSAIEIKRELGFANVTSYKTSHGYKWRRIIQGEVLYG